MFSFMATSQPSFKEFAIFTGSIPLQVETGDIPVGNPTESQVSQGRIMVRYRKYL